MVLRHTLVEDFVAYFYTKLPRNLMPHIHVEAGVYKKSFEIVYLTDDKGFFIFSIKIKILSAFLEQKTIYNT